MAGGRENTWHVTKVRGWPALQETFLQSRAQSRLRGCAATGGLPGCGNQVPAVVLEQLGTSSQSLNFTQHWDSGQPTALAVLQDFVPSPAPQPVPRQHVATQ